MQGEPFLNIQYPMIKFAREEQKVPQGQSCAIFALLGHWTFLAAPCRSLRRRMVEYWILKSACGSALAKPQYIVCRNEVTG